VATAEAMQRYPVRMIESGPAAGALMAAVYGELTGHRDLIAFDMGGTTAKLALIEKGQPATTTAFELHRVNNAPGSGLPMNIQAIDLVEIGAGGGSIARAKLGVIAVGPESASSTPGPVCYGRGGVEPTVTDADVVLGYINPEYFAGGSIKLQAGAAARAIEERVARPLGLSLEDAAWGIHTIVNTNMELATRVVSIERGRDPRDLTFVAFGGSGPVHGCRIAQALGIPRIVLPASAGVTAAIGLLAAEVKFDVARTYVRRLDAVDGAALDAMYGEMSAQAITVVQESAVAGEVVVTRSADARYVGQGYEVTVPVPQGRLDPPALERVRASFHEIYAARYGYANASEPVEVVTWKLSAVGGSPRIALAKAAATSADVRRKSTRRAELRERIVVEPLRFFDTSRCLVALVVLRKPEQRNPTNDDQQRRRDHHDRSLPVHFRAASMRARRSDSAAAPRFELTVKITRFEPSGPTAERVDWASRGWTRSGIPLTEISQRPTVVWSMPTAEKLTEPVRSTVEPLPPTVGARRCPRKEVSHESAGMAFVVAASTRRQSRSPSRALATSPRR